MSLTPKEERQLRMLEEKSKVTPEPISDEDLLSMQDRVDGIYDECPRMFRDIAIAGWNKFSETLTKMADDNSRLIIEIKRLRQAEKGREEPPNE